MTRYHAHLAAEDRARARRARRVRQVADLLCYVLVCAAILAGLYLNAMRNPA